MQQAKNIALFLFLAGAVALLLFFTPFINVASGEVVHTGITFQGRLLIGRLLLYMAALIAICGAVAIFGRPIRS
jgi:hypothetical protein